MAGAAPGLLAAILAMPQALFAVVDGAHFDDLPALLKARRLEAHPLYLEASDGAGVRAGPHLVPLALRDEVRVLLDVIDGKPATTFWSWPGNSGAFRRHLRGLNLAEIPNERRAGPNDPTYETVLFRHWDPNVLAVTLPVLTAEQRSRFLGNAEGVVFDADEYGGLTKAPRPEPLPPKPAGRLRFAPGQIEIIAAQRLEASHNRIAHYLREVVPIQTDPLDFAALRMRITSYQIEAREIGLVKERDIAQWACLQILSGNTLFDQPIIRQLFSTPDGNFSASERLYMLWTATEVRLAGNS